MTTRYIRQFEHKIDHYALDGPIEDALSYLTKKVANIRKKHPDAGEIRLDIEAEMRSDYGDSYAERSIKLLVTRPENDDEVFQRETKARKLKEAQHERDLEAFAKLAEKLGKES